MTDAKFEFKPGALTDSVNERFAKAEPGFFEASSIPVLVTPVALPAAVLVTQASVLCAAC
jgi:hypothetical protein